MDIVEYKRSLPPAKANPEEIMKWALNEFAKLEQVITTQNDRIKALEALNGA